MHSHRNLKTLAKCKAAAGTPGDGFPIDRHAWKNELLRLNGSNQAPSHATPCEQALSEKYRINAQYALVRCVGAQKKDSAELLKTRTVLELFSPALVAHVE
jgi:hypothetical protein